MSTRAIITISDETDTFHLYVYWYEWPGIVVPLIEKSKNYIDTPSKFEAWDFAAAIITVMKRWASNLYLIQNSKYRMWLIDYHYHVSDFNWNLLVKIYDYKWNTK